MGGFELHAPCLNRDSNHCSYCHFFFSTGAGRYKTAKLGPLFPHPRGIPIHPRQYRPHCQHIRLTSGNWRLEPFIHRTRQHSIISSATMRSSRCCVRLFSLPHNDNVQLSLFFRLFSSTQWHTAVVVVLLDCSFYHIDNVQ